MVRSDRRDKRTAIVSYRLNRAFRLGFGRVEGFGLYVPCSHDFPRGATFEFDSLDDSKAATCLCAKSTLKRAVGTRVQVLTLLALSPPPYGTS